MPDDPPTRPCERTKTRGQERTRSQERKRAWPVRWRALPSSLGTYAWQDLRRRNVKSNSTATPMSIRPRPSSDHRQLPGRPREAGIKPTRAVLTEGEAFIEQHDVVPLRPLSLMHGQRVTVVELVRLPSQGKAEFALRPLEERLQHRDLDGGARALVFRAQSHLDEVLFDAAKRLDPPQSAVDEALGAVIAQTDQAVPGDGQRLPKALDIPHALIVGAAGAVGPDQHLIDPEDLGRIDSGARDDARFAIDALLQVTARANDFREANDRIVLRLPMDVGQHDVRRALGEKAAPFDGRQLKWVAEDQDRLAEREEVASQLRVDHRTFVNHDKPGLRGRTIGVESEIGRAFCALGRSVNERMNGCRARTALRSHHQRSLARKGGESRLAARAFGDVARKGRFADSGVAKDAKHLGLASFEPSADLVDRFRLLARPFAADRPWGRGVDGMMLRPGCCIFGGSPHFCLFIRALRLGAYAAARTNRRLAAEIIIFGAAGQALAFGSELAQRRRLLGQ